MHFLHTGKLTTVMFILQASEALTQHLQVFTHNLQEMQSNQHIYSLLVLRFWLPGLYGLNILQSFLQQLQAQLLAINSRMGKSRQFSKPSPLHAVQDTSCNPHQYNSLREKMGILEKIAEIEKEIARTQKNKGIIWNACMSIQADFSWLSWASGSVRRLPTSSHGIPFGYTESQAS